MKHALGTTIDIDGEHWTLTPRGWFSPAWPGKKLYCPVEEYDYRVVN